MEAGAAARPFGRRAHGGVDDGLEDLPLDEFAHSQQGGFKRGGIKVLHELIEESGVAVGDEVCHVLIMPYSLTLRHG